MTERAPKRRHTDINPPVEREVKLAPVGVPFRKRPVQLQHLMLAYVIIIIFGIAAYLGDRQRQVDGDRARAEALAAQTDALFAFNSYRDALDEYNRCTFTTTARDDLRDVLFNYADGFIEVLPDEPKAVEYSEARHEYVDLKYPPLDPKRCGVRPSPPSGVVPPPPTAVP